ncbi:MAG TPA: NAD(P)/FAD-dependent oxidoreductase [Steroidobacteraceae bacterium]|nr:NAD(P)/FAD-dependent oxidoreductase [Steroidobacteraceae bacterium]
MQTRPKILVIGGGFGGLSAVRALRAAAADILLIDRCNHHTFQPLLYQVATAGLAAPSIAAPLRHILRSQRNVTVLLAEVLRIDLEGRSVEAGGVSYPYDFLIVATGSTHAYFGHEEWARCAPGLKTLDDGLRIRARILTAFERAEATADPIEQKDWLTFLIIGAGATGVELAGTLAEIARHTLKREFRHIDPASARILLIEAGARVLPSFPASLSANAERQLERLGVSVRTGHAVTGIDELGVCLGEERISARTVLWAAGVAASPLGASLGVDLDRAGRVRVTAELAVPGIRRSSSLVIWRRYPAARCRRSRRPQSRWGSTRRRPFSRSAPAGRCARFAIGASALLPPSAAWGRSSTSAGFVSPGLLPGGSGSRLTFTF